MKYTFTVDQLQELDRCRWLTDRERKVFNLYYRRGWAIEDVAAELYLSRSAKPALHLPPPCWPYGNGSMKR